MTDNLVNQGYSALMLSPISDSNLTSSVDNAKNKKIPTINVNDGLISAADYFVGPDAYPVSYTHLAVYKRQQFILTENQCTLKVKGL